eukprot:GAHX01000776.1.p1 GENE.GAHX01000776.1~~GAHX01000776.1.p1  ORF type:complete len:1373 (+),score=302.50 GAHX01000776.1:42-4160(+)
MPPKTTSEIYQKMTPIEHILKRPDTYVGSVHPETSELYVPNLEIQKYNKVGIIDPSSTFTAEELSFKKQKLTYVPAFMKIYDEILVNAADNKVRDDKMNIISVTIDYENHEISVLNDGSGIPVEIHSKEKVFIPEMIFGQLLTSSNYDDSVGKVTGGRNGYGAKLTNLYSTEFSVSTRDKKNCKSYKQIWSGNMKHKEDPEIEQYTKREFKEEYEEVMRSTKKNNEDSQEYLKGMIADVIKGNIGKSINEFNDVLSTHLPEFTTITFKPDMARLGKDSDEKFSNDMLFLLAKRAIDLAGTTSGRCLIYLNSVLIPVSNFEEYMKLYISGDSSVFIYEKFGERWKIGISASDGHFQHVSFVNAISTPGGGKHVNYIADAISDRLIEELKRRTKRKTIKKTFVKNQLFVFVNCLVDNPSFKSQTKEFLSSEPKTFGTTCEITTAFAKRILETEILEQISEFLKFKEHAALKKTDGKKTKRLFGIPKLTDAHAAGTNDGKNCALILTEGDSAKQLAMSGLDVVGQKHYGIFPLRGKMLNVRDASKEAILKNAEVEAMKKIVGLKIGMDYSNLQDDPTGNGEKNFESLRYGKIIIMADQDLDGSHIKGLIINFIHFFWPSLIRRNDCLFSLITPIVVATDKTTKEKVQFYSLGEFNIWKNEVFVQNAGKWTFKYYKGLGTSSTKEGKEYFRNLDLNLKPFKRVDMEDENKIKLAFEKSQVNERKSWILEKYRPNLFIDSTADEFTFTNFIDKELINFSMHDNLRSIPSFIDGLKPVQRKILYTVLKKNITSDVKVATLAAQVSSFTNYHHGEMSMYKAIVGMAQNYTGSNNINLLVPSGQFGSRNKLGKDSASARYIHTRLEGITAKLFPVEDLPVLEYNEDDGKTVEPAFFAPIIPTILANGTEGIGTGWSTKLPCFNPKDIAFLVKEYIRGRIPDDNIKPWYRGFKGEIHRATANSFIMVGQVKLYEQDNYELEVLETPINKDADDLRQDFENLMNDGIFIDVVSNCSSSGYTYNLTCSPSKGAEFARMTEADLLKQLKLTSSFPLTNMVLLTRELIPKKFDRILEIVKEHYDIRLEFYEKRKVHKISKLEHECMTISNQARFIMMVVENRLVLSNKKKAIIVAELEGHNFDKIEDTYDYLLNLKLLSLTKEKVDELLNLKVRKNHELEEYRKKSIKDIWLEEIEEFEKEYEKFEKDWHDVFKQEEVQTYSKGRKKRAKAAKSKNTIGAGSDRHEIYLEKGDVNSKLKVNLVKRPAKTVVKNTRTSKPTATTTTKTRTTKKAKETSTTKETKPRKPRATATTKKAEPKKPVTKKTKVVTKKEDDKSDFELEIGIEDKPKSLMERIGIKKQTSQVTKKKPAAKKNKSLSLADSTE